MMRTRNRFLLSLVAAPSALLHQPRRQTSSASSSAAASGSSSQDDASLFQRGAEARGAIANLWKNSAAFAIAAANASSQQQQSSRIAGVQAILDTYGLSETTQRTADVAPALGEAIERLLLLTVPIVNSDVSQLEAVLGVIGKNGIALPIRTVQHLFARVVTYPEAIAVFYAMRRKNVTMDMHAYHAMIYSLQRLEEESWAAKFAQERIDKQQQQQQQQSSGSSSSTGEGGQQEGGGGFVVSEQALDFIMNGVDNQLIPEHKPWLGRVLYADSDPGAAGATASGGATGFDALGKQWVARYRQGGEGGGMSSILTPASPPTPPSPPGAAAASVVGGKKQPKAK